MIPTQTKQDPLQIRLAQARLLAMDVDGVLTDGGVYILESGEEFRRFNIKDGLGLKQIMGAGIQVAWISNGGCEAMLHRARRLGIKQVFTGVENKLDCLSNLCREYGISLEDVVYIGDDLTDQEVLEAVGVSVTPIDAAQTVQRSADLITYHPGGQGAVREVCDRILDAVRRQT